MNSVSSSLRKEYTQSKLIESDLESNPFHQFRYWFDEAITKANNSPYGLSGGVWTDKGSKIFKVTKEIRSGVVWANTFNKFDPASPFGGYKESGTGSEGGIEGLSGYVNLV